MLASADLGSARGALALSDHGALPVLGTDGQYHGCVTARAVAEALAETGTVAHTVADLVEMPPVVTTATALASALDVLTTPPGSGVPVLSEDKHELLGWLTHQGVLAAIARRADV